MEHYKNLILDEQQQENLEAVGDELGSDDIEDTIMALVQHYAQGNDRLLLMDSGRVAYVEGEH